MILFCFLILLLIFAVYHQKNESRHNIAGYLFGPTCPRWVKILLVIGAYGGITTLISAFLFLGLDNPITFAVLVQIASGLYLGDGLVTHISREAPAHKDFIWLTAIGTILFIFIYPYQIHLFPWWVLVGLSVFIILRIIAARYKADQEISTPHSWFG